jgi:hypothetical protein
LRRTLAQSIPPFSTQSEVPQLLNGTSREAGCIKGHPGVGGATCAQSALAVQDLAFSKWLPFSPSGSGSKSSLTDQKRDWYIWKEGKIGLTARSCHSTIGYLLLQSRAWKCDQPQKSITFTSVRRRGRAKSLLKSSSCHSVSIGFN